MSYPTVCISLCRKPLDEASRTVAGNTLAHGTGGICIEKTRIPHAGTADKASHKAMVDAIKSRGGTMENSWKMTSDLSGASEVSEGGRWPANMILSHMQGCRVTGDTTTVGSGKSLLADYTHTGKQGATSVTKNVKTGAHYGEESVPVCVCVEGCPIAALDIAAQMIGIHPAGGARPSGLNVRENTTSLFGIGMEVIPMWHSHRKPSTQFIRSDTGGCSRFFKQVQIIK